MKTISERIKEKRSEIGLSQRALAHKVGVTSVAISRWELGYSQPKGKNLLNLSKVFKCTPSWLLNGKENASVEIEGINYALVPYYEEIEVAAGCGCLGDEHCENNIMPIPFYVLEKARVFSKKAICVKVKGDSMEPVLSAGSIIGVDTSNKEVDDGGVYVICHGDLLRVKLLYRYPNGIKLRSYNSFYEDEMYNNDSMADIKIIGKVFWASVFL